MAKLSIRDLDLSGKKVFIRVDFNVPIDDGRVTDDTRITSAIPTIQYAIDKGARVILASHLGRPKGERNLKYTLRPVAEHLARLLGTPVAFAADCVGDEAASVVDSLANGDVALLENLRFYAEEEGNDPEFSARLAALCDLYVNDAFSAAHRAHASTEGIAKLLPAYPGLAMERELNALDVALGTPQRPVLGIVGGSKVSTKLDLLKNLVTRLD
ncbi:MAG: phosphoglycerate kinase, partial [Acidobacteria bacterium]|nr:phosphoglycerate kinase [Acidobacteriota bacterium]